MKPERRKDAGQMCSVNVYLLLFILMMMMNQGEPGKSIPTMLCSGANLTMQVSDTAVAVTVFYNGKNIARSSDVSSMKWDKSLPENYKGRLSFSSQSDITITLQSVSEFDTGLCRIVTKSSNGNRRSHDWNVTVLVPPSVEKNADNISITAEHVNDSCSRLTCGSFSSLGKPKVNFKWTLLDSKEQTVIFCGLQTCDCHVVGPATKCLNRKLSAEYCKSNPKRRRKRSPDDKPCSSEDSKGDGAVTDPINPVPIVLGVLAAIIAIAVITAIIVFYKRRSSEQGVQGPPGHYNQVSVEENHDV